jgi:hypothetical protein
LITRENIKAADQEQLDQIYARLTAGSVPDGEYAIDLFRPEDVGPLARMARLIAGERVELLKGLALLLSLSDGDGGDLIRLIWQRKVFTREPRVALTHIGDVERLAALVPRRPGQSQASRHPSGPGPAALLFPAKVYCGQSLLDGRRESIIVDYLFSQDLPETYNKDFVWIMGADGLAVRDEIRMVRPGFYLGRAYLGRIFAVNFLLYREPGSDTEGGRREDCEIGSQRAAAAR